MWIHSDHIAFRQQKNGINCFAYQGHSLLVCMNSYHCHDTCTLIMAWYGLLIAIYKREMHVYNREDLLSIGGSRLYANDSFITLRRPHTHKGRPMHELK